MRKLINLNDIKICTPKNTDRIEITAESTADEIRFYFNKRQYVTELDTHNGGKTSRFITYIEKIDDIDYEYNESILDMIKGYKKYKCYRKCLIFLIISLFIVVVLITLISVKMKNFYISITICLYLFCIYAFILRVYLEYISYSKALKSKHTAEHMMCNFIKRNKRLPRNFQEIRNTTRFSNRCGSCHKAERWAKNYIYNILFGILLSSIGIIANCFCSAKTLGIIYVMSIFFVSLVTSYLVKKYKIFKFMGVKLRVVFGYILQYANTTKDVKEEDIIMAYKVARVWLRIVYPEYYDEEKDNLKF